MRGGSFRASACIGTEFGGLRALGEVECRLDILALEERFHIALVQKRNAVFSRLSATACYVLSRACLGKPACVSTINLPQLWIYFRQHLPLEWI